MNTLIFGILVTFGIIVFVCGFTVFVATRFQRNYLPVSFVTILVGVLCILYSFANRPEAF